MPMPGLSPDVTTPSQRPIVVGRVVEGNGTLTIEGVRRHVVVAMAGAASDMLDAEEWEGVWELLLIRREDLEAKTMVEA